MSAQQPQSRGQEQPPNNSKNFTTELTARLRRVPLNARRRGELPKFDYADASDLSCLFTTSVPRSFHVGTGASIYASSLLPALLQAEHEAVLVTCFWAPSKSLDALRATLEALARHRRAILDSGAAAGELAPLRVRICLSSRSFMQRLLHTSRPEGYAYPPETWPDKLGLPDEAVLRTARIEMKVKSLFFRPISVMHPKFLVVDRRRAFVPSCNVSWEPWLEGCVEIGGEAVKGLMEFYRRTWDPWLDLGGTLPARDGDGDGPLPRPIVGSSGGAGIVVGSTAAFEVTFPITDDDGGDAQGTPMTETIETTLLPSSHHRNPHFRPFPWQNSAPPPPTPLNVALLQLLEKAERHIFIQTPNLTCSWVVDVLLGALKRRVDVRVVTGRNMMLLEQIFTAGTITEWCVRGMVKRYMAMRRKDGGGGGGGGGTDLPGSRGSLLPLHRRQSQRSAAASGDGGDATGVGRLQISYFRPHPGHDKARASQHRRRRRASDVEQGITDPHEGEADMEEPVHSHLKLTIVDGVYTVLGSGNMDRPSWYTSQELGVLFHGEGFAGSVKGVVDRALEGRVVVVFDSEL